ncbi:uncharacterized protein LOC129907906 [Episyrphus balteatus]|uniref:uncharacterized protein LOC129907906 n=1 Tax=Episyrphus balteatus TaxID=286459 RepID=UPI0024853918|nr:uncharacterized protein LOC129907906 [Episyrphus balteatus]
MKYLFVLSFLLVLVVSTYAGEYQFGECGPKDNYLIAKDKVTKKGVFFGIPNSKKYVLKQKSSDPRTITCMIVTDRKKKCDASVDVVSGGIGSKGVTLKFKGKLGGCINSSVKVYGKK